MIYTVTFNPAIDYVVKVEHMNPGLVNRADKENIFFGGKGINVSVVLNELDIKSEALGFVAGFTGNAIEDGLASSGIKTDFVHLKNGFSRINVKIKSDEETELNGQGPEIDDDAINELYSKLDKLKSGDTLILAGSIPKSLPENIYESILARLENKCINFIVDATKNLLVNVLKYRPFLIKPNNYELEEIFETKLSDNNDIVFYAKRLQDMGAKNVLVSMAGNGAILVDENNEVHIMGVPKGKVLNSVGAGDSMVAGFTAGFAKTKDFNYALALGTAAGSATAFSEGLANKNDIKKLLDTILK